MEAMSTTRDPVRRNFVKFLMAGGVAAVCNYGSRFLYSTFTDFATAVVLAYLTGLTVAFLLNRRYVFTRSRNTLYQQISYFVMVNMLALVQTWIVSVYLARFLIGEVAFFDGDKVAWAEAIAHGVGVMLPVFTSYLGHKYLSFRE
ncbi:MAG: GtrA family protein [Halioglobus sp.]|nr:GtrA family protein [Halioglobus sp.]